MEGLDIKKIVIFFLAGIGVLLLVAAIIFVVRNYSKASAPVTVTYWGLWEPESVYQEVFADYKKTHPNVTIKYQMQSPIQYRERLNSALSGDTGPDIIRIHNSWMPMFLDQIAPVPATVYSATKFRSTFYPVAATDLIINGTPYAIPLEIDSLALFVNTDLLTAAGVAVPTNWEEFREAAKKLTVKDDQGRIKTAGTAMGTAGNVDGWQDIVSLMMLQAGVDMAKTPNTQAAQEALLYYTTFVSVDGVWAPNLDGSTLAFSQGKVAMYFGSSWRFFDIKNMNSNLNFRVVPVPQLPAAQTVNFSSYWAEAVSKKSKNIKEAFDLLNFMSSKESLTKIYTAQAKIRPFGEPYPRVDMATMLTIDPNVGPFVAGAATAKSSYLDSATGDGETGINSRFSQYYGDAVNMAGRGNQAKQALDTVAAGVKQVLESYGVK